MRRLVLLAVVAGSLFFAPTALAGWCGTGTTGTDLPDIVTGAQVHAIVALPADGPDTFAATANRLADDAAAMTAWWQGQDPTRIPRFDVANFGGNVCLDISFLRLPDPGATYTGGTASFNRISQQLRTAGFSETWKDYYVYYDGPSVETNVCGTGGSATQGLFGPNYAVMWLHGCTGVGYDAVGAHELLHALGALPAGAPHACTAATDPFGVADSGHPCDSPADILYPQTDGRPITEQVLDVNHDDYYGHSGSWQDLQDSVWLHRLDLPPVTLTVSFAGGRGEVTSDVPGVACTTTCSSQWDGASVVGLDAQPAAGSRFLHWAGACTGVDCRLTLNASASVTAVFGPARVALRVTTAGKGSVKCTPACAKTFPAGDQLRLRAVPAKGWKFVSWSGACKGTRVTCAPSTETALSVRATFRRKPR